MARKRRHNEAVAGELNLTAMIDVAFQLLSFFIITSHPQDVLTNLDVFAPSAQERKSDAPPPNIIRIAVTDGAFMVQERPIDLGGMRQFLDKMASLDKSQTVLITCDPASTHKDLVDVLDLCARSELVNISIASMNTK